MGRDYRNIVSDKAVNNKLIGYLFKGVENNGMVRNDKVCAVSTAQLTVSSVQSRQTTMPVTVLSSEPTK